MPNTYAHLVDRRLPVRALGLDPVRARPRGRSGSSRRSARRPRRRSRRARSPRWPSCMARSWCEPVHGLVLGARGRPRSVAGSTWWCGALTSRAPGSSSPQPPSARSNARPRPACRVGMCFRCMRLPVIVGAGGYAMSRSRRGHPACCSSLVGCGDEERPHRRPCRVGARMRAPTARRSSLRGSRSCRACHERFYELWAPSHHGTAMQPFTAEVGATLPEAAGRLARGRGRARFRYDAETAARRRAGREGGDGRGPSHTSWAGRTSTSCSRASSAAGSRSCRWPTTSTISAWYDTTASMIRHAVGHSDEAVDWTDPLLTFNTSCWNCHVSQLSRELRPRDRHLREHVGRARHQLRDLPRSGRRARPRSARRPPKGSRPRTSRSSA